MEVVLELIGFKGDGVILRDLSGRDILWPKDSFPESIQVGERVSFLLGAKELNDLKRQQVAKDVLNELINSDN